MPRARYMWPEHRAHRKVGSLTDLHYRVWVGMVMEADDEGRVIADPAELRAKIFPFRTQVTVSNVKVGIRQLAKRKLIALYAKAGNFYAYFPSWKDWQHPKYPTASKLPIPPVVPQDSPSVAVVVPHHSPPGGVGLGGVGVGWGGEGCGRRSGRSSAVPEVEGCSRNEDRSGLDRRY